MKNLLIVCLLALIASIAFSADAPPSKFLEVSKVSLVWLPEGKVSSALIKVKVLDGFHIQSNPAAKPNLRPTVLNFPKAEGIEALEVTYPAGKPYRMQNGSEDISIYEGTVELKLPLKAISASLGKHEIKGELKYQACNEKTCFFPKSEPITIPVEVFKNK
jgi:hypothetical protein